MADLKEIVQALESIEVSLRDEDVSTASIDLHLLLVQLLKEVSDASAQCLSEKDREQISNSQCVVLYTLNMCGCINPLDFSMTWYMWILVGLIAWCFGVFMYFFFFDKNFQANRLNYTTDIIITVSTWSMLVLIYYIIRRTLFKQYE